MKWVILYISNSNTKLFPQTNVIWHTYHIWHQKITIVVNYKFSLLVICQPTSNDLCRSTLSTSTRTPPSAASCFSMYTLILLGETTLFPGNKKSYKFLMCFFNALKTQEMKWNKLMNLDISRGVKYLFFIFTHFTLYIHIKIK